MDKKVNINKVKNRILFLAPSTKEGLEKECSKEDFFSEGDKPIGKGGFGQVWKVRHKATENIYVIKVMNKQNIIEQKMVEQINREIEIMYKLNHPNIIKLFSHFEDDDNLYLVMHFASKGQLYSLLKKQNRFDQRSTAQYMREVICAVKYLHSFDPPIIHRDIKPENILLDEYGKVKLADFGWSNYVNKNQDLRRTYCGTPEYLAPEMITKEGHDTSVDIWDLGVLMFELLSGKPPFGGMSQGELFTNIKKHRINWPDDFPPLAKNLITKILKQNPKERAGIDEIISHAWFEKNPPLRPVLQPHQMDEKQWLESHVINNKNENLNEEINKIVKSKQKVILEAMKKNSSTALTAMTSATNQSGSKGYAPNNASNQHLNFNSEKSPIPQEIDSLNFLLGQLNESNEKIKKENLELKQKNDKSELENKTLKNEIIKLKDPTIKAHEEVELQSLKEELDKYKIINKDRLGLLTEIEEKTNEIMELRKKLKTVEDDIETNKRNNNDLLIKYNEEKTNHHSLDLKLKNMKTQLDAAVREKDETLSQSQKKIEILQQRFLENSASIDDNSELKTQSLLEMINETIAEFKDLFNHKTANLQLFIDELKDDSVKTEKKLSDILLEKHHSVIDNINKVKVSLEEEYIKAKIRIDNENPSKINDRLEWLKKQITELMPYKIKSSHLEKQLTNYDDIIKRNEERIDIETTRANLYEKLLYEKNLILEQKKGNIENLEAKLGDIKDFIFRNCADKLEDFSKWYKF